MKYAILVTFGLLPLAIGHLVSHLLNTIWFENLNLTTLTLISWGTLVLWGGAGYVSAALFKKRWHIIALQNAVGGVALMILIISLTSGNFGHLSFNAQTYFLSVLRLAAGIPLLPQIPHWSAIFFGAYGLFVLATYVGILMGSRRVGGRR